MPSPHAAPGALVAPAALALALVLVAPAAAAAAGPATPSAAPVDSGGFVVRLGADTLGIERFRRTGDSLSGLMARRLGHPLLVGHAAALDGGARVREIVVRAWTDDDPAAAPRRSARLRFRDGRDMADLRADAAADAAGSDAARDGAVPMVRLVIAHVEQVVRRAWALEGGRPRAARAVPVYLVDQGGASTATVTPLGGDSLAVAVAGRVLRLVADAEGRVLAGVETTEGWHFARTAWLPASALHPAATEDAVAAPPATPRPVVGEACGPGLTRDLLREDRDADDGREDERLVERIAAPAPLRAACAVRES